MSEFNHLKKLFSEPNEQSQGLTNCQRLNLVKSTLELILEGKIDEFNMFKIYGNKTILENISVEIQAVQTTINIINKLLQTTKT